MLVVRDEPSAQLQGQRKAVGPKTHVWGKIEAEEGLFSMKTMLIFVMAAACSAQTLVDLRTQTKDVDFSGAISTRPVKVGSSLPPTCATGELFFNTIVPAGSNVYGCTSANTWSIQALSMSIIPGTGTTVAGTATQPIVNVDPTVVPFLGANNAFSGLNNMSQQIITKAIAYTTTTADWGVLCDTATAGGPVTLNLPPLPTTGLVQWFKNLGSSTCTVNGNSHNIDGSATLAIVNQNDSFVMQFDGTQWRIAAKTGGSGGSATSLGVGAQWAPVPWSNTALAQTLPFASNNKVHVWKFALPASITLNKLGWDALVSDSTFVSFGIYDSTCSTLLAHTTPQTPGSTGAVLSTFAGSPVSLNAGTYYMAVTSDGTTHKSYAATNSSGVIPLLMNVSGSNYGIAGSGSTGSGASLAFPASCGGITNSGNDSLSWYVLLAN